MPWGNSTSRTAGPLPANWPSIRCFVLERDQHTCQIQGPRCTGHATEVDHIGDGADHTPGNLRAACQPCHATRTAQHANQQRWAALRRHHQPAKHPGLI